MNEVVAPGTPRRVEVIFPPTQTGGLFAEGPESLVEFRGQLAFAANFEDGTRALWTSDGTEAGTFAVKTLPVESPALGIRMEHLTPAGERLFFTAGESVHGNELWVSDGTPSGTGLVADLTPGPGHSYLTGLTALGSTLTFFRTLLATETTPERTELWRSDGTASGTVRLRDFGAGTSVGWQTGRADDVLVFFVTGDSGGTAVWRTDGTAAGTQVLRSFPGTPVGYGVADVNSAGRLTFFSLPEPDDSTSVWKTDGTRAGTVRLYTFAPDGRYPRMLTALGDHLYVSLTSAAEQRAALFRLRVDGVGGKEHVVTLPNPYADQQDAWPYISSFTTTGGRLFFELAIGSSGPAPRDTQLWVTDGTKAGTRLLRRPLSLSDEYGSPIVAAGADSGLVFFAAYDGTSGIEPWVTDGTVAGTRLLKDVAPATRSSYPREYLRVGDQLFFSAFDDTEAGQLWTVPLLSGP
ncbi:ELWxxDGT repeat protein [Pyxidicoccus sp. 3LG]